MAVYVNLPTLNVSYLKPEEMEFFPMSGAFEGGRNGLGDTASIDLFGGPKLAGSYENCFVQAPDEHGYVNWLSAYLASPLRLINVPVLNDWSSLFPLVNGIPSPFATGTPHSDGATFSDGAGYSQATVFGTFEEAAALNAGQIKINVFGAARNLGRSITDWMSTYHSVKGWRAWRYWECSDPVNVTRTVDGHSYAGKQYTLGLDIPLRQAVEVGQRIEFARPRCVMKLPAGESVRWRVRGFWQSRPSLRFEEAF